MEIHEAYPLNPPGGPMIEIADGYAQPSCLPDGTTSSGVLTTPTNTSQLALRPATSPDLTSFTISPNLSPEIRRVIWQESSPSLNLRRPMTNLGYRKLNPNSNLEELIAIGEQFHNELRFPVAFRVSQESRIEALQYYTLAQSSNTSADIDQHFFFISASAAVPFKVQHL
ncbi:hypothetical protein WAI453_008426 [Rhynchosporium graminicola]|uniref:2EXR domain-containing protein n=1 Tax=Rhynchosporium graminicola TaxID=2792576 RepID=A0A1E1KLW1_9HELO|nr:uncharacterized protein RCO7_00400 [Rhynchosporium commune]